MPYAVLRCSPSCYVCMVRGVHGERAHIQLYMAGPEAYWPSNAVCAHPWCAGGMFMLCMARLWLHASSRCRWLSAGAFYTFMRNHNMVGPRASWL